MTSLRILGYSQTAAYLGILAWLLSEPGNLYSLVSPMLDLAKIVEFIYLGFAVLLYPSISLYVAAKSLTIQQWSGARLSQTLAFVACLILAWPAFIAEEFPQLFVACVAGILSFPVMLLITSQYKKTNIH